MWRFFEHHSIPISSFPCSSNNQIYVILFVLKIPWNISPDFKRYLWLFQTAYLPKSTTQNCSLFQIIIRWNPFYSINHLILAQFPWYLSIFPVPHFPYLSLNFCGASFLLLSLNFCGPSFLLLSSDFCGSPFPLWSLNFRGPSFLLISLNFPVFHFP